MFECFVMGKICYFPKKGGSLIDLNSASGIISWPTGEVNDSDIKSLFDWRLIASSDEYIKLEFLKLQLAVQTASGRHFI